MKKLCGFASRCLAVIVTAAVACASPQAPHLGGDPDAGTDAGSAGGDPDAAEAGDLETMCGSVPTTVEDWERCRVKRLCETYVHCTEKNLYTDAQECVAQRDSILDGDVAFDVFESVRAVADGRASIDVAAFTQCLTELSTERCNTAGTAPPCEMRYTGTIADGQSCFSDAECVSPGAHCEPRDCGNSCCAGTCTPRAKLGQSCNTLGVCLPLPGWVCCEPGLACSVGSLAIGTCVIGDVGSACDDDTGCDSGNWCDRDHGICKPDLPEGAACGSVLQCGGETTCVKRYRDVEPKPRCFRVTSVGDTCDENCLGNLRCDKTNPDGFGVCRWWPRRGEACSGLGECIGRNDRCGEQGMCISRTELNQPCAGNTCLPGLFCTNELKPPPANPVCSGPLPDGQSCTQDVQCQSRVCSGNPISAGQCMPVQSTCP